MRIALIPTYRPLVLGGRGILAAFGALSVILSLFLFSLLLPPAMAQGTMVFGVDQDAASPLTPAEGYEVSLLARGLPAARLLALTPRGDVLVSQGRTGMVSLLPLGDMNSTGSVADKSPPALVRPQVLLSGLDHPHGLALVEGWLYIAEERVVSRYRFDAKARRISGKREVVLRGMPGGGHSTRTIRLGPDGWFYVSVGSSCNVCIERHPWRAALLKFKPGQKPQIYATGLRNTVGYDWHPVTGALYGVDNGRDWLGDELPPGEVNLIRQGGFYGWPFFYGANVRDQQFRGRYDETVHGAPQAPIHEMKAHVAPLSLRFLPLSAPGNPVSALITQHGSWNRSTKIGYKVVQLSWDASGAVTQKDFLTGFLHGKTVFGRPVDTLPLPGERVLISDDRRGVIWLMRQK